MALAWAGIGFFAGILLMHALWRRCGLTSSRTISGGRTHEMRSQRLEILDGRLHAESSGVSGRLDYPP